MSNKNRIELISSFFDIKNSTVLDVGTDHALVPIFLVKNNLASKVYFTEINKLPYTNALSNIKKNNLSDYIEGKIGDGTTPYFNLKNIDYLSITGLGTNTIIDVIKNTKNIRSFKYLILESTNDVSKLRLYLKKHKYKVISEKMIEEGNRVNIVMKVKKTLFLSNISSKADVYIGPKLKSDSDSNLLVNKYIDGKIDHYSKILDKSPFNLKIKNKLDLYNELKTIVNISN